MCTCWLCFVPLLPTFTESLPWNKHDLGSGPNLIHSNLFPPIDGTHSGQQSSCGPFPRLKTRGRDVPTNAHLSWLLKNEL